MAQDAIAATRCAIDDGLVLAIHLATALEEIYQHRNAHGALHPTTILIATNPTQAPFVDHVRILEPDLTLALALNHRLSYAAPEQTGRLNWPIDQRTDLYTVGVILYHLFTGRLPFEPDEPLPMVYAHIATPPTSPVLVAPQLPVPISDIIDKLLTKEPVGRYQSTVGFVADLNHCLAAWRLCQQVDPFTLGAADIADHLLLPNKLYGRAREWERVLAGFNNAMRGASNLLVLTGEAGIGKTALMAELAAVTRANGATVIAYRADAQAQNSAYATISGLLADSIQQLLAKPTEQVKAWQARLATALAGNSALLPRAIPELALILDQPEQGHAELADLHHLLQVSLQKFLMLIAEFEQPLVVLVDDAHQADRDSLQLMRELVQNSAWPLLAVWACRSPSGAAGMDALIDELSSNESSSAGLLHLSSLSVEDTGDLLRDTFHAADERIGELAELLHTKTLGNPFFLREYLHSLWASVLMDGAGNTVAWAILQSNLVPIQHKVLANITPESVLVIIIWGVLGWWLLSSRKAARVGAGA